MMMMKPCMPACLICTLQVTTATVVVVLDLSDPSSVLPTASYWIDQVCRGGGWRGGIRQDRRGEQCVCVCACVRACVRVSVCLYMWRGGASGRIDQVSSVCVEGGHQAG